MTSQDPAEYVSENHDALIKIIKHSSDKFVRALALSALIEYGDDPTVNEVIDEVEQFRNFNEDE